MTSPESALHVEVLDDEIVITLSGTSYAVTYYRATAFPQRLLTKSHSGGEDHDAPMTQAEFHGRAWRLANDKARELVDSVGFSRRGGASHALRPTRAEDYLKIIASVRCWTPLLSGHGWLARRPHLPCAQCSLPILFLRRLKVRRLDGHHLDGGSRLRRHENYGRNSMVSRKR
jgi:hypothetical protein